MFSEQNAKAGVTFPQGFKAAGVKAGIKKSGNLDVAVIYTEREAAVAGVFTQNAVAAAPVFASKKVVATGTAHAIAANAGCANACTGAQGEKDARAMQEITAAALGCTPEDVLVASTGVIGVNLPMDKMEAGLKAAVAALRRTAVSVRATPLSRRIPTPSLCHGGDDRRQAGTVWCNRKGLGDDSAEYGDDARLYHNRCSN